MTRVFLQAGHPAPDFTLPDKDGKAHTLSGYRGQKVILYFFPAASTPGCTTQACDFRDNMTSLRAVGYAVLGLSKDKIPELRNFAESENLHFPLLSDEDLAVHKLYGAYGEKVMYGKKVVGVIRSTFVIDANGTLEHTFYNTKATGHVALLKAKIGI